MTAQVYWNPRQSRLAEVVTRNPDGSVKAITYPIDCPSKNRRVVTWKRGIPHGWTLWKDAKR